MLAQRILATIKFFDLQDYPLTAFEVQRYLVSEVKNLVPVLDENYELTDQEEKNKPVPVQFDTVLQQLHDLVDQEKLICKLGFYCLPERTSLIRRRLLNYQYGVKRERLIARYLVFAKHVPFVRGIALAGSQALGLQRPTSDIDLLIITDPRFMWLGRIFLTLYFQILGKRRHGKKIANRFCLNHYLGNAREVDVEKNLYKAMEYTKLRPVVYPQAIYAFQKSNEAWIKRFFPNVKFDRVLLQPQSNIQKFLELLFNHRFGLWFERHLGSLQLRRIQQDKFIFVKEDELSFHPDSKHEQLLKGFYETKPSA